MLQFAILSPTGQRGWISFALLGAVIAIPYVSGLVVRGGRRTDGSPKLVPLWPHYWVALLVAGVTLWHAWPGLRAGHILPGLTNGLWLATVALILLLIQLGVGAALRYLRTGPKGLIRRVHFILMTAIVLLVLAHIWLNSRLLHSLF